MKPETRHSVLFKVNFFGCTVLFQSYDHLLASTL